MRGGRKVGGDRGPWQGGLGWEGKAAAAPHHAPQMPPSHPQQAAPFIVHCYCQQSCQNLSLGILNLPTPQQQGPWGHCSSLCQHLPPFSPQPTTPPGPCICPALLLPPGRPSGFCCLLGCPLLSSPLSTLAPSGSSLGPEETLTLNVLEPSSRALLPNMSSHLSHPRPSHLRKACLSRVED